MRWTLHLEILNSITVHYFCRPIYVKYHFKNSGVELKHICYISCQVTVAVNAGCKRCAWIRDLKGLKAPIWISFIKTFPRCHILLSCITLQSAQPRDLGPLAASHICPIRVRSISSKAPPAGLWGRCALSVSATWGRQCYKLLSSKLAGCICGSLVYYTCFKIVYK